MSTMNPNGLIELGCAVRMALNMDDKRLLWLGAVEVGGVALRDGSIAVAPFIRSVDGVDYPNFELREIVPIPGGGVDIFNHRQ